MTTDQASAKLLEAEAVIDAAVDAALEPHLVRAQDLVRAARDRGPATPGVPRHDTHAREVVNALASALRAQQAHLGDAVRDVEGLAAGIVGQLRQAAAVAPIERLPTLQSQIIHHRHVAVSAAQDRLLEVARPARLRAKEIAGLLGRMDEARTLLAVRRDRRAGAGWSGDGGQLREVTDDQVRDAELAVAAAMRDAAQPSTLL